MKKIKFTPNGIIGRSGKWYGCKFMYHIRTVMRHRDDCPVVYCHNGDCAFFEAYFTEEHTKPTRAQFETLMDWCTAMEVSFEEVIIRPEPWEDFIDF